MLHPMALIASLYMSYEELMLGFAQDLEVMNMECIAASVGCEVERAQCRVWSVKSECRVVSVNCGVSSVLGPAPLRTEAGGS